MYWLLKSEPETYSWTTLSGDIETRWDGIRNYQARNYMKQMKIGDSCFFYHSGKDPGIVGLAEVASEAYPDPNDDTGKFLAINIKYKSEIKRKISLKEIAKTENLCNMKILKQSRLSISPVTEDEWLQLLKMTLLAAHKLT